MTVQEPRSSNELAEERTSLAARRSLMAADRTLMAWVRTSLSMISFGFTIYKVMQGFQHEGMDLPHPDSPRRMGLFLTGMGTLAMVMGTVEYLRVLVDLRKLEQYRIWRPSFVMALIMAAASVFLFVGILLRGL